MKKKFLAVLVSVVMLGLVGCQGNTNQEAFTDSTGEATVTSAPESTTPEPTATLTPTPEPTATPTPTPTQS